MKNMYLPRSSVVTSNFMKDKWKKIKEAGFTNLAQAKAKKTKYHKGFEKQQECDDCKDRPKWLLKDLTFSLGGYRQLCNRHIYLFVKKFEKWFLEDVVI